MTSRYADILLFTCIYIYYIPTIYICFFHGSFSHIDEAYLAEHGLVTRVEIVRNILYYYDNPQAPPEQLPGSLDWKSWWRCLHPLKSNIDIRYSKFAIWFERRYMFQTIIFGIYLRFRGVFHVFFPHEPTVNSWTAYIIIRLTPAVV